MRPFVIAICALGTAATAVAAKAWEFELKPISGVYAIYGGGLGDPVEPTAREKKIALVIKGKAAREIFDGIGPDVQDACLEPPHRVRKRDNDNFICMRVDGEYSCKFGFDLVTGKSIGGSIC